MIIDNERGNTNFLTILKDGKFHKTVLEGTEGAVIREYEDKEGNKKTKTETVHDAVRGIIKSVSFVDGMFGENLQIEIDTETISMGTATSFAEDLMKKLPSIKSDVEVTLTPYSFEADGKMKKGITVFQDLNKVTSYYWDKEAKKDINGIPEVEGDVKTFKSDDWKMHFMKQRKFLVSEVEKLSVFKKVENKQDNLEQM